MLDPSQTTPIELADFDSYMNTFLALAEDRLSGFGNIAEIAAAEDDLNQYPRLDLLQEPRNVEVMDESLLSTSDLDAAVQAALDGRVLWQHTCAGEATRLGLGNKYLIDPRRDLTPEMLARLLGGQAPLVDPQELEPFSLGRRHMLQLSWDLWQLALANGRDPATVLRDQQLLVIANEASAVDIHQDFLGASFYGFQPCNVLFMVQKSFHGLTMDSSNWSYDQATAKRLHNHGQVVMQTTMDGQMYRLCLSGDQERLAWSDYQEILKGFWDIVSFNIEDLGYLERSLDLPALAASIKLGERGYRMVMEVVANNPEHPQKGGSLYWVRIPLNSATGSI